MYRIAYRNAIALLRKRNDLPFDPQLLPESADPAPSVEHQVLVGELATALYEAISSLDHEHRAAFVLRDVQGLSTADTAAALGIGESAVEMRLSRARKSLRIKLKEYL